MRFRHWMCLFSAIATIALAGGTVWAQPATTGVDGKLTDAAQSDPHHQGWMRGFPPPPDKILRFSDGTSGQFPATRWSFNHERELGPSRVVSRGAGNALSLPRCEQDLDELKFVSANGDSLTWAQALSLTYSDAVVVLRRGCVAYERYFGEGAANRPHIAMSVTKSFVGVLAAELVAQGKLRRDAKVTQYLPELKNTAYAGATLADVMDMRVGVRYSEIYADPTSEVWDYARASGSIARGPNYEGPQSIAEFLLSLKPEGRHGGAFSYKSVNTEVLAWVVKRVSGESLSGLLSQMIWSRLGMEDDAYFMLDGAGAEAAAGGLNGTARDFAKFGELIRCHGSYGGQQILAPSAIKDIFAGGDKSQFAKAGYSSLPGWSYRDMWWISDDTGGSIMARGVFGQSIYINPAAEVVIIRFASHPVASNIANDPITLPAYAAVADALSAKPQNDPMGICSK